MLAELIPDSTQPGYQSLLPLIIEHGLGVAFNIQYYLAQIQAGIAKMPGAPAPPHQ